LLAELRRERAGAGAAGAAVAPPFTGPSRGTAALKGTVGGGWVGTTSPSLAPLEAPPSQTRSPLGAGGSPARRGAGRGRRPAGGGGGASVPAGGVRRSRPPSRPDAGTAQPPLPHRLAVASSVPGPPGPRVREAVKHSGQPSPHEGRRLTAALGEVGPL